MTTASVAAGMPGQACPRLRWDVRLVERVVGGERSAVVKDPASGKYFRMQEAEVRVLRTFDGTRGIPEIVRALAEQGLQLSEAAVEAFVRSCARLGILERSFEESTTLELERLRAERRRRRSAFRGELMRMRWSFGDADRVLTATLPLVRWCFTRGFVAASIAAFAAYGLVIALAWTEFTRAVLDVADLSRLSAGRVATYVIVTLLVTLVHELGHAFTCKHHGGNVRELGFMLVYLQPAFYCNVNDAWGFPSLRARLWVTAAGMWIQMVVAGVAAVAWWLAAPGTLLSEVMLAAMIAGGLTSVLTNANPLLPLDGYFALTDWLNIPNLRQRGLAWADWWVRHRVLGLDVREPPASAREARAIRWYGALAGLYITAMLTLFAFIVLRASARTMGGVGALLALTWLVVMLGGPLRTWTRALGDSVRMRVARARRRAAGRRTAERRAAERRAAERITGWRMRVALTAVALVVAGALPWPERVRGGVHAAGVQEARVVAPIPGLVSAVLVHEGERVAAGAPLLELTDLGLSEEVERIARTADSLGALARSARARGAAGETAMLDAAHRAAVAGVATVAARAARVVRAPVGGTVETPRPERLLGRRVIAGDALLALDDADSVEVRVALVGVGSTRVRAGQELRLVSLADPSAQARATVLAIAARGTSDGAIEVRAHLARTAAWRPGVRGDAQLVLGRTTVAGALLRAMLGRVRAEVWL
jgi:putative peptide zinc metalloprotease protein